jgi:hypothetical protein
MWGRLSIGAAVGLVTALPVSCDKRTPPGSLDPPYSVAMAGRTVSTVVLIYYTALTCQHQPREHRNPPNTTTCLTSWLSRELGDKNLENTQLTHPHHPPLDLIRSYRPCSELGFDDFLGWLWELVESGLPRPTGGWYVLRYPLSEVMSRR